MDLDTAQKDTGALNPLLRGKIGSAVWQLINASYDHQKAWRARGRRVMKYYHEGKDDNEFAHQRLMREKQMFHRSVLNKTFEAVSVLGPLIRPTNPYLEIFPDERATEREMQRLQVDERYINSTSSTNGQSRGMRQAMLPFLAYGRAITRPGMELGTRGVIGTRYYDTECYYFDPSAKQPMDISWQALVEKMKVQKAKAQWKKAGPLLDKMRGESKHDSETIDMVYVAEFYTILPMKEFTPAREDKEAFRNHFDGRDLSKAPLKYTVASACKNGKDAILLDVQPWEVPLHNIDEWPIIPIDAYEDEPSVGCLPVSPLYPAIDYQVAMNKVSSLLMSQFKEVSTLLFGKLARNRNSTMSEKAGDRIALEGDAVMLEITGNNSADIRRVVQQFNWNYDFVTASINLIEYWETKYATITGVHAYLQTGDPAKQDRSASATNARQRAAYTRVNDLRDRVAGAEERIGRINAVCLRYLKDAKHIDKVLGPEDSAAYGYLGTDEDQDPAFWLEQLVGGNPQMLQMMDENQRMGLMQEAQSKAEDCYTMEEVYRQTAFKIRIGSDVVPDRQERLAHLERQANQLMPTLLQDPNPMVRAEAFEAMAIYNRELGYEDLARKNLQIAEMLRAPPPPPMQPEGMMHPGAEAQMPPQEGMIA
jgi:hypothetical protein